MQSRDSWLLTQTDFSNKDIDITIFFSTSVYVGTESSKQKSQAMVITKTKNHAVAMNSLILPFLS